MAGSVTGAAGAVASQGVDTLLWLKGELGKAFELGADIRRIADATRINSERLQEFQYTFQNKGGISADELDRALLRFTTVVGRAAGGDQIAKGDLARVGVDASTESLLAANPSKLFEQALGGLAKLPDDVRRASAGAALFTDEVGPILATVADDVLPQLERLSNEAGRLGFIISDNSITGLSDLKKEMDSSDKLLATWKARLAAAPDETLRDMIGVYKEILSQLPKPETTIGEVERLEAEIRDKQLEIETLNRSIAAASAQLANKEEFSSHLGSSVDGFESRLAKPLTGPEFEAEIRGRLTKFFDELEKAELSLEELRIEFDKALNERRAKDSLGRSDKAGSDGYPGGQLLEPRASGGPVSAYAPYMVGERGPELFVPRASGAIVSNRALGASQWPWSAASPEVGAAKDAIGELQELLDELDFDWQGTFNRMTDVLLDFAKTGKFEWRDLAKIALDSIEQMLRAWLELQAQKMAGGEGETNPWSVVMNAAGSVLGGLFGGGSSAPSATASAGGYNASGLIAWSGKAAGGPVAAFTPYMVGERGPELFVPRVPGAIVPNHALGGAARGGGDGGRPVIVNLNVSPGVPEAVRREVAALIPQITQAAKLGVASDMDRNGTLRRRMN